MARVQSIVYDPCTYLELNKSSSSARVLLWSAMLACIHITGRRPSFIFYAVIIVKVRVTFAAHADPPLLQLASIAGVCSSLQRMASAQQQVALQALQAQLAAAPPGSQVAHSLQGLVRVAHAQLEQGQQQQQGSAPLMVLAQVQVRGARATDMSGEGHAMRRTRGSLLCGMGAPSCA